MLTRILIATSDGASQKRLITLLEGVAQDPAVVSTIEQVWEALADRDFDILILERSLVPIAPGELLQGLSSVPDAPGVLVVSREEAPEDRAVLLSAGVVAVLWLGLTDSTLRDALLTVAGRYGKERLGRLGAERAEKRSTLDEFVSASPAMQRFVGVAKRVVQSDSALLILGETGVGKERLARSIHAESRRRTGPFIPVHCGAIPETLLESELFGHEKGAFTGAERPRRGLFELAHKGTVFLDEVGEMPLHLQVKLLRALEDRRIRRLGGERSTEIDVRVMAATNRRLETEVAERRFRSDLYYRLAVVTLTVPPLRERLEDLPTLAQGFLEQSRHKLGRAKLAFHPDALTMLRRHDWPGNVRELINVIERAALMSSGTQILVADLQGDDWSRAEISSSTPGVVEPPAPDDGPDEEATPVASFGEARETVLASFERRYLSRLLTLTKGRVGAAARLAQLNERTLYGMMKRHGIRKEDFRPTRSPASR